MNLRSVSDMVSPLTCISWKSLTLVAYCDSLNLFLAWVQPLLQTIRSNVIVCPGLYYFVVTTSTGFKSSLYMPSKHSGHRFQFLSFSYSRYCNMHAQQYMCPHFVILGQTMFSRCSIHIGQAISWVLTRLFCTWTTSRQLTVSLASNRFTKYLSSIDLYALVGLVRSSSSSISNSLFIFLILHPPS